MDILQTNITTLTSHGICGKICGENTLQSGIHDSIHSTITKHCANSNLSMHVFLTKNKITVTTQSPTHQTLHSVIYFFT